jgi:hypothetical protein
MEGPAVAHIPTALLPSIPEQISGRSQRAEAVDYPGSGGRVPQIELRYVEPMIIRPATAADDDAIRGVHDAAFGRPDEGRIVDALRAAATLSLAAELDGCAASGTSPTTSSSRSSWRPGRWPVAAACSVTGPS